MSGATFNAFESRIKQAVLEANELDHQSTVCMHTARQAFLLFIKCHNFPYITFDDTRAAALDIPSRDREMIKDLLIDIASTELGDGNNRGYLETNERIWELIIGGVNSVYRP